MPEEMEFGHDIFGYTTLVRDNDVFVALTGRDVAELRVGMKVVLLGDSRGYVPSGFSPGDEVMIVGFAEPFKGGTSDHIVQVTKDSERGWVKPSNIQRGLSAPTAKPTNPLPSGLPGLSSEFIQVDFPEPRDVLVDGMVLGTTGKALLVPRGTHVVSLGGEQNYSMQVTPISVVNTTFTTPLIITATLNAQTAPPSAQKRVALLVTPEVAGVVAAVLSELNIGIGFNGSSADATKTPLSPDVAACDLILFNAKFPAASSLNAAEVSSTFGAQRRVALIEGNDVPPVVVSAFDFASAYTDEARLKELVRRVVRDFLIADEVSASVSSATMHDRATAEDALGFEPYVAAVGEFLLNKDTLPPLTMSVEGSWGSGKSSFMLQLQKYLKEKGAITISFNAWRHEKAEEMWAAFAIHFIKELKRETHTRVGGLFADLRLTMARFDWRRGAPHLLRALALVVAFGIAAIAVPVVLWMFGKEYVARHLASAAGQEQLLAVLKALYASALGVGGVSAGIPLFRLLTKQLRNPLEIDLGKYVNKPDYESKLTFLERFHEDLGRVIDAYAPGRKIFVFIDDLDRCEVPHAADLMQALNLMLSDNQQMIFIMGIDREKVAAGLAVKHEKLIPYLSLDTPNKDRVADTLQGIAFGYDFIEKFIQVPFVLPAPSEKNIEKLLEGRKAPAAAPTDSQAVRLVGPGLPQEPPASSGSAPQPASEKTFVTLQLGTDSPIVIDIAKMVAPALEWNPRRVKQFVNLFRLRATIASSTGLFDAAEKERHSKRLTLHKLGKFVALELRWPLLLAHLEQEPGLIADLEGMAIDGSSLHSDRARYWSAQPALLALLRRSCVDKNGQRDESGILDCSLGTLDLTRLLRVSALKRGAAPPPPPPPNPPVQTQSEEPRLIIKEQPPAP